jgi:tetratricopeptide (TPR) repeat protein
MITDTTRRAWPSRGIGVGLIVLLTGAVYLPALRGGFIWDDRLLITENQMIRAGDGLYRLWLTTEPADYWPLTSTLWWLEWRLWGDNVTGYHAVNVALHAANAVLIWFVLRRLNIPGAWLAAILFAIHPVNVATAAWISEQKNTLSMLFCLLAVLSYLQFDEQGRWRWYGLSLAAFLLALLSKTAVVMLPVAILGCVWWRHDRVRRRDAFCSAPFFALSLVLGLVTIWFQHRNVVAGDVVRPDGWLARLVTAGWVPWFYLGKAVLPLDLIAIYPKWRVDSSLWVSYLPGLVWIGWLGLGWIWRKSWGRPLSFGLGYFVVMLAPVMGFVDQGFHRYSWVADPWQYHAIIGVIALAVAAGRRIFCPEVGRAVAAAVVVAFSLATWERCLIYADDGALWRDTVARNPGAWLAHNNLGVAAAREGRIEDALAHLEEAVRLEPNYAPLRCNWGNALLRAGNFPAAIEQYKHALRIKPGLVEAHYNLAIALERAGRVVESIEQYEQTLRLRPDYPGVRNKLARLRAIQE